MSDVPGSQETSRQIAHRTAVLASDQAAARPQRHRSPQDDRLAGQPITVGFVLRALRRWWKVAVPAGLALGAVAGVVVWYTFQPLYLASTWLRILDRQPYVAFRSDGDSERFVQTQVELLRSPFVLGRVVSQPEIARLTEIEQQESPISWLAEHIRVVPQGQSEFFEITYESPDPQAAALIVNAVIAAYLNIQQDEENKRTNTVVKLLEDEQTGRKAEIALLKENLRSLNAQANPADVGAAGNRIALTTPLGEIQRQFTTAEVEYEVLSAQVRAFQETTAAAEPVVPAARIRQAVESNAEVQQLMARVAATRALLPGIEETSRRGRDDPEYQRLLSFVARDEASLKELRDRLWTRFEKEVKEESKAVQQNELEQLQARHRLASTRLDEYREKLKALRKEAEQAGGQSLSAEFLKAELTRKQNVLELISQRIVALTTEMRAPSRVNSKDQAKVPTKPVEAVPYKRIGLASLASFCLPLVLLVFWERFVRRISDSNQLEESSTSVLAEVPRLPMKRRSAKVSANQNHGSGLFEESIDGLRTCLVLSEPFKELGVLALSSAVSGEGKTTVAAQLAVSIARASGEPTLLIDADLRSPDVHNVFGVSNDLGLAKVLTGNCTAAEAIILDWSKYIHLMPAGRLRVNPHKILGSREFLSLLTELRASYRYIVVDTPPVLSASESLVVAKAADGVLLCAMRDVSRADQVHLAYERLVAAGARPVGAVLNGVSAKRYSSVYGSYRYETTLADDDQ